MIKIHVYLKDVLLHAKTPKILAGVLASVLILEWGLGMREARRLDQVTEPPAPQVVKTSEPVKQLKQHDAVRVDLFGEYVPHGLGDTGVQRSKSNASIIGILFSSDEQASQVLIEVSGHNDKVFKLGDKIPGGAIIKRITPDGILLMRDGVVESLSLPQDELLFAPPSQPMGER